MLTAVLEGLGRRLLNLVGVEAPISQLGFDDVVAARDALLTFVPPELAYIILDFAEYWVPFARACTKSQGASASVSPNHDATNIYLISDPVLPLDGVKVKRVQFIVSSRDQGWCSDATLHETYRGSTWHEAAILRSSQHTVSNLNMPDLVSWLARSAPIELESAVVAGYTSQFEVPISDADSQSRWLVQKNFTSSRQYRTHVVTWDAGPIAEDDEHKDIDERLGAGIGRGFIELLVPGDTIAVMVRAKYPAWVNHVEKAEIIVYYGLT
ncbi:hypothetical protein C8F01DRAFT_617435 [Mycena amicta]|nr:hypothetical protein C8F01DRAFT_617435 [Mycena amicta]